MFTFILVLSCFISLVFLQAITVGAHKGSCKYDDADKQQKNCLTSQEVVGALDDTDSEDEADRSSSSRQDDVPAQDNNQDNANSR